MISKKTNRLVLRNFQADDWQELQNIIVRYQESEYAQYDHEWPTAPQKIKEIIAWFAAGDSYLAVCLETTRKLIGLIAIDRREAQVARVHNLGFIFHPSYQGQGYASESCRAAIHYVFTELSAEQMLAGTHPDNTPAVSLFKKLGFKEIAQGKFSLSRGAWMAAETSREEHKHE